MKGRAPSTLGASRALPAVVRRAQHAGLPADHAGQIFHLLRRQMIRLFRKPLVILTPKSLLRNKEATSPGRVLQGRVPDGDRRDPEPPSTRRRSSASCCARARSITTCSPRAGSASSTTSRCCVSSRSTRSRTRPRDRAEAVPERHPGGVVPGRAAEPGLPGSTCSTTS
jgi:hypothetical protein